MTNKAARRRATTHNSKSDGINWTGRTKALYEYISLKADREGTPYWMRLQKEGNTRFPTDETGPVSTKLDITVELFEYDRKDGTTYEKYEVTEWGHTREDVIMREYLDRDNKRRWMITAVGNVSTGFEI